MATIVTRAGKGAPLTKTDHDNNLNNLNTEVITKANNGANSDITSLTGLTTPLAVGQGGIGTSTLTDGGVLLGSGTGGITATAAMADGEFLVGDGTADPVLESGATVRTSLGLGTAAVLNTGVAKDDVIMADSTGLPVIDGTQLTGIALLATAQEWTKTQNFNLTTLASSTSPTWDLESNQVAELVITSSDTMSLPSNMVDGGIYTIMVRQNGAGTGTLAWNSKFWWAGGATPTITTSANAIDIFVFLSNNSIMYEISRSQDIK